MGEAILAVVLGLIVVVILIAVMTVIFMWIWNAIVPDVFGWKQVTFYQALGILILAGMLFGGHRVVEVPAYTHDTPAATKAALK